MYDFIFKIYNLIYMNMYCGTNILYIGFYIFLKKSGMHFSIENITISYIKHCIVENS